MSLFQFYIKRERSEKVTHQPTGYTYDREFLAYSESAYFHSLAEAQLYAQKHTQEKLTWDGTSGDYWFAQQGDTEYVVTRMSGEFEPVELTPLPQDFHERRSPGD